MHTTTYKLSLSHSLSSRVCGCGCGYNTRQLLYSIVDGNDAGKFKIDAIGGVVTVDAAINYEISEGGTHQFLLTVQVADNGIPSKSSNTTVTVNVNDRNDNPPLFELEAYNTSVYENATGGTFLLTVAATDADSFPTGNGEIRYEVLEVNLQDTSTRFQINGSGALSLKAGSGLDHEAATSYSVYVRAYDNPTDLLKDQVSSITGWWCGSSEYNTRRRTGG